MNRFLFVCLVVIMSATVFQVTAESAVEEGVVRILSGRDREEGTGFIRCAVGEKVFIITAYHVVEDSMHCNLEFYGQGVAGSTGEVIYANVEDDVAVVTADIPEGIGVETFALNMNSISRGTEVIVCGFPQGGGDWKIIRGTYEASKDGLLEVTAPSAYRGHSGGPIIAGEKVIGMVIKTKQRGGQKKVSAVPAAVLNEHLRSAVVCVESAERVSLGSVHFSEKTTGRLEKWFPDADAADELEVVGLEELRKQLVETGWELVDAEVSGARTIDINLISISRIKQTGKWVYATTLELNREDGSSTGEDFGFTGNAVQMEGDDYNMIVVKSCLKKSVRHAVEIMTQDGEEK